jgi:hypothetical protein
VSLGMIGGFLAVGGPGYARMEKNDAQRTSDLRRLAEHYRCIAVEDVQDGISPRYCGGVIEKPDLRDPVTDTPYEYTSVDPLAFQVCATFETDQETAREARNRQLYFDGQVGCLRYRRASAGADWVQQ